MRGLLVAVMLAALLPGAVRAGPAFRLSSADFRDGAAIPARHEGNSFGCAGRNIPPTLSWTGAPVATRSFALTMVDPDAPIPGGFVHWVIYNMPPRRMGLGPSSLRGTQQGINGAGSRGYVGPCPPPGSGMHHYHFTLYALGVSRLGGRGLTVSGLRKAMRHHVLGAAALVGTFQR